MTTTTVAAPTPHQIRELVELAMDTEVPGFTMEGNWYEDYAMDSISAISLVVEVQKMFGVMLPDDRMPDVRTGNQLLAIIVEMLAQPAVAEVAAA